MTVDLSTKDDIYFNRNDLDTYAMARLDHSLMRYIQNHEAWRPAPIEDIPLSEQQMVSLIKSYRPDWESRYAPYYMGGWFYITRSGHWLKKFSYKKGEDGFYHIVEHFSTAKLIETNLLQQVLREGYFDPPIFDDRLKELFFSKR